MISKSMIKQKTFIDFNQQTKYIIVVLVCLQILISFTISNLPFYLYIPITYFVGGTINRALLLTIHDLSKIRQNLTILSIFGNLPLLIPIYGILKKHYEWKDVKANPSLKFILTYSLPLNNIEIINLFVQLIFNCILCFFFFNSFVYLLLCSLTVFIFYPVIINNLFHN